MTRPARPCSFNCAKRRAIRLMAELRSAAPSPPPGAERVGVRWGIPERSPIGPPHPPVAGATGPSLSPLKGGEGNSELRSQADPEMLGDGEDVLVAAPAHVHHD